MAKRPRKKARQASSKTAKKSASIKSVRAKDVGHSKKKTKARKVTKKKKKGVSRIDSGTTHGWFVRGYKNGKTYSRLFSDAKYGGKRKAQQAAQEYRNELFEKLEQIEKKPRARRIVFSDSRNRTGVIGVSRQSKVGANGSRVECFSVSWRPAPGVQKCTSFSIRKYGEEKAFKMAVNHRRKMLKEIHSPQVYKKMASQIRESLQ